MKNIHHPLFSLSSLGLRHLDFLCSRDGQEDPGGEGAHMRAQ